MWSDPTLLCDFFSSTRSANGAFVFLVGAILLATAIVVKAMRKNSANKMVNSVFLGLLILGMLTNLMAGSLVSEPIYSGLCEAPIQEA